MDLIFYHGKIYMERDRFAQAMWIQDGVIREMGSDAQILQMAPPKAERIDLDGRLVLPGMNDSHQHLCMVGEHQALCDLSNADSIAEIQRRCKVFLETYPDIQGLHGVGWNQDYFTQGEKRPPTRQELDEVSEEIPIVLERVCGHLSSGNSKALELAGICADTVIAGGEIWKDAAGMPDGIVTENACSVLDQALPPMDEQQLEALYIQAMELAVSQGITSVQSNDVSSRNYTWMLPLWKRLHAQGKLLLRYRHQCCFMEPQKYAEFLETVWTQRDQYDDMLSLGPLKLFKDGSLGARTALMRSPYQDDPSTCGTEALDQQTMDTLCRMAADHGQQIVTHVIGDAAVEQTLNSYEKVIPQEGNILRHGLVHCQITDAPLLQRIADMQVAALVQPIFLHYDLHIVEDRVGKDLAGTSYAFATLGKLGVPLSLGTDAPVEPFHPFRNIYCAVTRKDLNGYPPEGFFPAEEMTLSEAIDAYTIGSSYAEFKEDRKGRLKPGYYADYIVLDRDIFTLPAEELLQVQVDMTVVNGSIVYQRVI